MMSKPTETTKAHKPIRPMAHQPHNVTINDTPANWLAWGNLVLGWINGTKTLPKKVSELNQQMVDEGVNGLAQGKPGRGVSFVVYPTDGAIVIPLPNPPMVQNDADYLASLTNNGANSAAYPLPTFYSLCFSAAQPAQFSLQQLLDMEARRIGEYVINECM
jgi:hypothetical protein